MSRSKSISVSLRFVVALNVLLAALASVPAQSEVREKTRPILDIEGNKVFSKKELLDIANKQLDEWTKNGATYGPDQLDYCLHTMRQFMQSGGYLQAKVARAQIDETEEGSRVILSVDEGPLFRVSKIKIDEARLFSPEQIRDEIGFKSGDIVNGEALSQALYERLKTRYAKFGYIQYAADIEPTFHVNEKASDGVVDLTITIDEGDQFTVRSIKIIGVDSACTNLLRHELLIRNGDIYDDELFRESVKRLSSTALVEPIDADKDVDFSQPDQSVPVMDLIIHVKRASRL